MSDTRTNTAKWSEAKQLWRITVQRDGVRKEFTSSKKGRAGQAEANNRADLWLLEGKENTRSKDVTLLEAYQRYCLHLAKIIATRRKAELPVSFDELTPKAYGTYKSDLSYLHVWLVKGNEHRRVKAIDDFMVQSVLDKAANMGRSKKTVSRIRGAISSFLKFCRRNKFIKYKFDEIDMPSNTRLKGKTILQPEALKILFSSDETVLRGRTVPDPYINAYRFQVLTGLRPGELAGLQWADLDGGVLHIRRSINIDSDVTQGKNQNALRDIRLFPFAKAQLDAQRSISSDGPIFDIPTQRWYYNAWRRYTEHNNIPYVTPYELRHTFVSIIQQLPEATVKALVGHSKAMDTGVYTHDVEGYAEITANRLNAIFTDLLGLAV